MSFFDSILETTERPKKSKFEHHCIIKQDTSKVLKTAKNDKNHNFGIQKKFTGLSPAARESKPTLLQPIKLSFLRPCPLCRGRAFTWGSAGGFFCTTCQPGITGSVVEATGLDREIPKLGSYPHVDSDQSSFLDDSAAVMQANARLGRLDSKKRENFIAARPWIMENMSDLLDAGWSRAALFRRGKHRHPYGNWGVAWLSVWTKPGLITTVDRSGAIVFKYYSAGRMLEQTVTPTVSSNIIYI